MERQFIVVNGGGRTLPKEKDPVTNVKPLLPTGIIPKDEDLDEKDRKILVLKEAADKNKKLLPTQFNRIIGKETDSEIKGIRPLIPHFKY